MAKALKVIISGSYHNSKKEVVDFENLEGLIPLVDDDVARRCIHHRFAEMWVKNNKDKFPERCNRIRECYIDATKEVDVKAPITGKSIHEFTYEDIQWFATLFDLNRVPLFKVGSLRHARNMAYIEYAKKVLHQEFTRGEEQTFNIMEHEPIIIGDDAKPKRTKEKKITNEEMIDIEQNSPGDPQDTLSREELEKIAEQKGISYNKNISDKNLYKKIFSEAQSDAA